MPGVPTVWYYVRDLDQGRRFYRETLGFEETAVDFSGKWSHLQHGDMLIGLAQGEPDEDGGVAHVDVRDLKAEADRLGLSRPAPAVEAGEANAAGNGDAGAPPPPPRAGVEPTVRGLPALSKSSRFLRSKAMTWSAGSPSK